MSRQAADSPMPLATAQKTRKPPLPEAQRHAEEESGEDIGGSKEGEAVRRPANEDKGRKSHGSGNVQGFSLRSDGHQTLICGHSSAGNARLGPEVGCMYEPNTSSPAAVASEILRLNVHTERLFDMVENIERSVEDTLKRTKALEEKVFELYQETFDLAIGNGAAVVAASSFLANAYSFSQVECCARILDVVRMLHGAPEGL